MKKCIFFCLIICICLSVSGCAAKQEVVSLEVFTAAESQWNMQIQMLQQEVDALKQYADSLQQTIDALTAAESVPEEESLQLFNYYLINGKYCAASVKADVEIPEILTVPNTYNGIEVAYTGNELINGLPVKTIIFEQGVECSAFLCGYGNNCPTLEKIIFLSEDPKDSIYREINEDYTMPLQLNNPQLAGACKIYVPDGSVDAYIEAWESLADVYGPLIRPLSELDAETLAYIQQ